MKEINTIIDSLKTLDPTEPLALATVVRVEGSSYRRTGARMLVTSAGRYCGGISGGCLEGDALRHAQKAILNDQSSVVTYDTTQDDAHQIGVGLGCNGIIDVLISPVNRNAAHDSMHLLESIRNTRVPRILCTVTGVNISSELLGQAFLLNDNLEMPSLLPESIHQSLRADIGSVIQGGSSATRTYSAGPLELRIFIELILPAQHLVLFGGNYDVYPLLRVGKELGWMLTVVTNIHKADKELFRLADQVVHSKPVGPVMTDEYTAAVLMAHDLETDLANLEMLLPGNLMYIGMLGPRKRAEKIFQRLAEQGRVLTPSDRNRIHAPAGLDIGAVSPEEIAVSIVAEIRAAAAKRNGQSLKWREGSIHA